MDYNKNNILKEIAKTLKLTSSDEDSCELLDADIQEVKEKIRTTINNHIYQLRIREQWLLQHSDNLHECLSHVFKADAEKLAEIKGQLRCCVEIGQNADVGDNNAFNSYASEVLQAYKKLTQESQHYTSGSICFTADDRQLMKDIRKFGQVINAASAMFEEGSDTWEFPETESVSSESDRGDVTTDGCVLSCPGHCSVGTFEIEDINKHFEQMQNPVVPLSQVCKANEVCSSIKECVGDEPCHLTANQNQENHYVSEIEMAFKKIARFSNGSKQNQTESTRLLRKTRSTEKNDQTAMARFNQQVSELQQQFARINASDSTLDQNDQIGTLSAATPWSVGLASAEISSIINPSRDVDCPSQTTSESLDYLMSEIRAIVNGEMPMYGVDSEPPHDLPPQLTSKVEPASEYMTPAVSANDVDLSKSSRKIDHINTSEKIDEEKKYIANSKGWCTIEDMQDILTGILRS